MPKNNARSCAASTPKKDAPPASRAKSARRYRHTPSVYQTIARIEALAAPGRDTGAVARLGAVVILWTIFMVKTDPAATLPRIYRALLDAWAARRAAQPEDWLDDETDRETCDHHGAVLEALEVAEGRERRAMWPGELKRRVALIERAVELVNDTVDRLKEWVESHGASQTVASLVDNSKAQRADDLRDRLDRLTDITDESERFRIEREIYELEHPKEEGGDPDDWSAWGEVADVIGEEGGAR